MSVVKRLASYAGVDILAALLGLFTSPIITRLLSVEQYGAISYIAAVWAPFLVARYAGIDWSFVFFKARKGIDQDALIVSCTKVVGVASIIVIGIFLGFVWISDVFRDHQVVGQYEVLIFALGLLPIALVDWLLLILRFAHRATIYAKISIVQKVVVLVAVLPAMYLMEQELRLLVYFAVTALSSVAAFLYAVKLMNKVAVRPFNWGHSHNGMLKELLSYGLFLVPGGILYSLISVADKLLVGALVGVKGVAILALAITLSAPITMMNKWVSLVLNPLITDWIRELDQDKYSRNLNQVLQCLPVIFFPAVIFMTIWSKPVVVFLYTESYYESAKLIPVVSFAGVLAVLTFVAISTVLISQKKATTLKVNIIALAANVSLSLYLIPSYGSVGAAWGTVLAEFIILLTWAYLGTFYYKNLVLGWKLLALVILLVFLFVVYGSLYFYSDVSIVERVMVSLVCLFSSGIYFWTNIKAFAGLKKIL
jgi:O-antigen/teichoic acid export membrane protein